MNSKICFRELKKNEQYACDPSDVKKLFSQLDVSISFGYYNRHMSFDSRDHKHPRIKGTVIASAYFKDHIYDQHLSYFGISRFLHFYVIQDDNYDNEKRRYFIETYLPQLLEWFGKMETRPETSILGALGSENFLIEWRENKFYVHRYHY